MPTEVTLFARELVCVEVHGCATCKREPKVNVEACVELSEVGTPVESSIALASAGG